MTRKYNIFNDQSTANDGAENEIICNTEVSKSSLCDCNDSNILIKDDITNCITKVDGTAIGDDEDLDLVMPMYNLIECSSNYS